MWTHLIPIVDEPFSFIWLPLAWDARQGIRNMNRRSRVNKPCIMTNISHIRFKTYKGKIISFLSMPSLMFIAVILYVPFLFTEKKPRLLLNFANRKYMVLFLPFLLPLILSLAKSTFTNFLSKSPFLLLDTHGHKFIDWSFLLMCVVWYYEGTYCDWSEFKIRCTMNNSEIST